jgi:hypothetical protein
MDPDPSVVKQWLDGQTSGTKSLIGEFGEPGRTRTSNPLIKSQLLYH